MGEKRGCLFWGSIPDVDTATNSNLSQIHSSTQLQTPSASSAEMQAHPTQPLIWLSPPWSLWVQAQSRPNSLLGGAVQHLLQMQTLHPRVLRVGQLPRSRCLGHCPQKVSLVRATMPRGAHLRPTPVPLHTKNEA